MKNSDVDIYIVMDLVQVFIDCSSVLQVSLHTP